MRILHSVLILLAGLLLILPACAVKPPPSSPALFPTDSDNELIQSEFKRWSPGYSSIKVLNREGDGTGANPRVLTIQATINSYPDSVVCEGELVFFHSDPSYLKMGWYTLEGIGHALLVQWASSRLKDSARSAPSPYQPELVSLLLKRWIDSGLIKLDDIKNRRIHDRVKSWVENLGSEPTYDYKDAGLFDTSQVQTYDLAPELQDDQKVPIYILLSDGVVELYLVDKAARHEYKRGAELPSGVLLPNPIPKPVKDSE